MHINFVVYFVIGFVLRRWHFFFFFFTHTVNRMLDLSFFIFSPILIRWIEIQWNRFIDYQFGLFLDVVLTSPYDVMIEYDFYLEFLDCFAFVWPFFGELFFNPIYFWCLQFFSCIFLMSVLHGITLSTNFVIIHDKRWRVIKLIAIQMNWVVEKIERIRVIWVLCKCKLIAMSRLIWANISGFWMNLIVQRRLFI